MKSIKVNNVNVAYREEGEGEPLIFIHGFCGSTAYWDKVFPALSDSYRVIAVDLPGHGESDVQNTDAIESYATFVYDFLEALQVDKVTLFGHSLGGYITLAFAEKYHDRLNAFSLIHSTGFPDSEEAKEGRNAAIHKIEEKGIHTFIEGLVPKLFAPSDSQENQPLIEKTIQIGNNTDPHGAKNALKAMRDRIDRREVLNKTDLPVLLVAGSEDQLIPPEKTFSAEGDHINEVVLQHVGHMSMLEAPDELVKAIRLFL